MLLQFDPDVPGSPASGKVSITVYAIPSAERPAAMVELEASWQQSVTGSDERKPRRRGGA
jgi:hypothetical protein